MVVSHHCYPRAIFTKESCFKKNNPIRNGDAEMMSDVLCNRVSDRVALLACALGDPTMPNYLVEVAKPLDAAARLGLV
jgi:hypothetical protein